jgi:hypothetical protein
VFPAYTGQLGLGHTREVTHPEKLPVFCVAKIVHISAASQASVFLSAEGVAYRCGKYFYLDAVVHGDIVTPEPIIAEAVTQERCDSIEEILDPTPPEGSVDTVGDWTLRYVDVAVTDSHTYLVSADGRLFAHGRGDDGVSGHRTTRFDRESRVNPAAVDLPSGLFVYRVFASKSCVFLLTNRGLFGFGWQAPLGRMLVHLEHTWDAKRSSQSSAFKCLSRIQPTQLAYFKVTHRVLVFWKLMVDFGGFVGTRVGLSGCPGP